jgi:hypothetical protein
MIAPKLQISTCEVSQTLFKAFTWFLKLLLYLLQLWMISRTYSFNEWYLRSHILRGDHANVLLVLKGEGGPKMMYAMYP